MDILSNLKYAEGSKKRRKRVGRGIGSGHGKTSCRGENGQKSRTGAKHRAWFEGGQMPLQRRVPKFGFTNVLRTAFVPINLERLNKLIDETKLENLSINPQVLYDNGILTKKSAKVKILSVGELKSKITIEAHSFSKRAIEKIEAAGGKAIILK